MSIILTKNIESWHQIQYINAYHYYVQKLVNKGKLIIEQVPNANMLAHGFVKALRTEVLRKYWALLGISLHQWNKNKTEPIVKFNGQD